MKKPTEVQSSLTLALDSSSNMRITKQGYLLAEPRVARLGIQEYAASELGIRGHDKIRVMRPEDEVFSVDSLQTYAHLPITLDHTPQPVDAANWRNHAVGTTSGEIMRDGDYIRIPLMVMDKKAVETIQSGRAKELSLGYAMLLDWESGSSEYDAVARNIRGNHLAIVKKARGGPALVIDNDNPPHDDKGTKMNKTVVIDGLEVEISDNGKAVVERFLANWKEAKDALEKKVAALETSVAAKDTEIQTLKQSVEDSKLTPERIGYLVADRTETLETSKKILGSDGKDLEQMGTFDMKKAVLQKRLGDTAKDWTPEQVDASFKVLADSVKDAAPGTPPGGNPYLQQQQNTFGIFGSLKPAVANDAGSVMKKKMDDREKFLANAYKNGDGTLPQETA